MVGSVLATMVGSQRQVPIVLPDTYLWIVICPPCSAPDPE